MGVVIPRDADDVRAAVTVAREQKVALLPRGGGTSLTGQTVNRALVMDFTRYMNEVLEVNVEEQWARVQPGLVQDELNHHVRPLGFLFGPDTSTSNRATLGGMMGNNSGGSHSIAYGLTVDHVIEIRALLVDGTEVVLGDVTPAQFEAKCRVTGLEGAIYREVAGIREQYADEIRASYPRHWRRVAGYNLNELVGFAVRPHSYAGGGNGQPRPLSMARLVVGSEGTLLTILEAKVRLMRRPKATALDVIHYHDMQEALESSQSILETGPYAVEVTDKIILDLARDNIEQSQKMGWVQGDPAAIMIVEYAGETEAEVRAKVEGWRRGGSASGSATPRTSPTTPAEQRTIWNLRKAGLGLLLGMKGDKKPIAFVEDTCVEPQHLAEFVPRFKRDLRQARHRRRLLRPLLGRLPAHPPGHRPQDPARARAGAGDRRRDHRSGGGVQRHDLQRARRRPRAQPVPRAHVRPAHHGRPSGELKTRLRPRQPDESRQHRRLARASPTTCATAPSYKTWEPKTLLDFSAQGGFAASIEMCNGVGCLPQEARGHDVPLVHGHERRRALHARARQRAARRALRPPAGRGVHGARLYEVMDLCLECKGCKAECPSNVDMAKLKYEFLHHYYQANGLPLRNRLFGRIARLNQLGVSAARARQLDLDARARAAGCSRRSRASTGGGRCRRWRAQTFTDWFARRTPPAAAPRGEVVLFNDTFTTYNVPEIARAAVAVLEAAGYRVVLIDRKCCGRPLISKGMLAEAREHAAWNVERLAPYARRGVPIVGLEPSCLLTLRDETVELCARTTRGRWRRSRSCSRSSWSASAARGLELSFRADGKKALLHGHCHQKALVGTAPTVAALRWAGFEVRDRLRLLRHGRLVRLRARALRHLGRAREPPAGARGEGRRRGDRDRRARDLVPPADSASGRAAGPSIRPRRCGRRWPVSNGGPRTGPPNPPWAARDAPAEPWRPSLTRQAPGGSAGDVVRVTEHVHDRDLMDHLRQGTHDSARGPDGPNEQLVIRGLDRRDGGGPVPLELRQKIGDRHARALGHLAVVVGVVAAAHGPGGGIGRRRG